MKISQKGPFQKGYNAIVKEEVNKDMGMDFGVLCMDQGDVVEYNEPKEVIYTLTNGVITFEFEGKKETADRPDCFHNDPILLHVPENTPVKITCLSDHAELSIQRTTNKRHFAPKLYRAADCLCPSEERGKGTLGEASTRIVRTFFDRSTCPETNFFIGEVVNFPGKWSSFPPHSHVEPEIYFYKFLPENGYGFGEFGDEAYKIKHNDLTGMPDEKTHSQCVAPGYAEYYLWVIRLQDDKDIVTTVVPEYAWTTEPGAKYFPEL